MNKNPKVTVLMSVYNGEKYLKETIKSILKQKFKDFEFLIINDGSTDKSIEIIESYSDNRIKLINNEKNIGLTATLNKGLDLAQGEYIARIDSDDISLPIRLKKQVNFMDENPQIGVCGSWVKFFQDSSAIVKYPLTSNEIKVEMLFENPLAHPSVIIRKDLLKQNNLYYDTEFKSAQDYELWTRASKYFDFANIPEVLLYYRWHESQVSRANFKSQDKYRDSIIKNQLMNLDIFPSEEELLIHKNIPSRKYEYSEKYLKDIEKWFSKIVRQNLTFKYYDRNTLKNCLSSRWLIACKDMAKYGVNSHKIYKNSEFAQKLSLYDYFKFFLIRFAGKIGYYDFYWKLKSK